MTNSTVTLCNRIGELADALAKVQVDCARGEFQNADASLAMIQVQLQSVAAELWRTYHTSGKGVV